VLVPPHTAIVVHMTVFTIVINVVLVAATLVVIWYAKNTVTESRKATDAARATVAAVEALQKVAKAQLSAADAAAQAAENAVTSLDDVSSRLLEVAQLTHAAVEAAKAAHEADERDREIRRLREIGELVERIFEKAADETGYHSVGGWRCMEQRELPPLLVGVDPPLPVCDKLAGDNQARQVFGSAQDARREIAERLRQLHADRDNNSGTTTTPTRLSS